MDYETNEIFNWQFKFQYKAGFWGEVRTSPGMTLHLSWNFQQLP